jgi:exo-beta-1,3-glucanase (GH17 family)
MAAMMGGFSLVQLTLLALFAVRLSEATGNVGVNYGTLGNNLPSPLQAANLLLATTIRNVKIYNPDPAIMQAFANTNIKLIVGVPTESIPVLATSAAAAQSWFQANIAVYMPATQVSHLAIGNEVLINSPTFAAQLIPAMTNLHSALQTLNLSIAVGTPHNMNILSSSYPPSSGTFQANLTNDMKSLLSFLNSTNAPLMVNFYPYFAYRDDPGNVSLPYALFTGNGTVTDVNTGLRYSNMLDAQLDAVYSAMERVGYGNIPILVSETGWPSGGEADEPAANPTNAQTYNLNLIKYVTSNKGTPLRPGKMIDAYIFALFNENLKPGESSERFFGLFNANRTPAYNLGLMVVNMTYPPVVGPPPPVAAQPPPVVYQPPPIVGPPPPVVVVPAPPANIYPPPAVPGPGPPGNGGKTWCVAKPGSVEVDVINALEFACGEGGADCSPIQVGGACYIPNSVLSHASVAFNSYYQKMGRNYWNCYFGGTGVITITDPSYTGCTFH